MNIYLLGKKSNQLIYKILSLKTSCDRLKLPKTINNINYMYGGGVCSLWTYTFAEKRNLFSGLVQNFWISIKQHIK